MSNLNLPDAWRDENFLIEHLAKQLIHGRLGLFLGAGVSQFYDLPSWSDLLSRMCRQLGHEEPDAKTDVIKLAATLRDKYFTGDPRGFKALVKSSLYEDVSLDFEKIRRSDTLAAIGSLVMSSQRGSVGRVFTLNYDNLLERYLEFHGFTTATVADGCHWAPSADVAIYHPHGFLPLGADDDSDDIVLGTDEYEQVMQSPRWRPVIETALRQHTMVYIGLSGDDMHLQDLWMDLSTHHAISRERVAYHGIRFSRTGSPDPNQDVLRERGIHTHQIPDYPDLPKFLFRICQAARDLRMGT